MTYYMQVEENENENENEKIKNLNSRKQLGMFSNPEKDDTKTTASLFPIDPLFHF